MAKLKYPPVSPVAGKLGSAAKVSRNKKGDLVAKKDKNYAGVSQSTMKEDAKVRAKNGDGTYNGGPAPRVGGKQKLIKSGDLKSATKKTIRQSRRKPSGSPQARRSQKRNRL